MYHVPVPMKRSMGPYVQHLNQTDRGPLISPVRQMCSLNTVQFGRNVALDVSWFKLPHQMSDRLRVPGLVLSEFIPPSYSYRAYLYDGCLPWYNVVLT